ncbi:MAG: cobalt-precorrin-5B (C(1))-methyltransferase [Candidatus Desantisbacteria bacterium]
MAKKTLNSRLGIIGGISILGTTGIVTPVSSEAWMATITSSMNVAMAMGQTEIVLSTGRMSEKAHMKRYGLPEECYIMMGDFVEFSLLEAKRHGFKKIYLNAQWAKMLKIAMATPQTHVKYGAIDINKAVEFLKGMDNQISGEFNTARELFHAIDRGISSRFAMVCAVAKGYAQGIVREIPVTVCLVSYDGEVIVEQF